MKLKDASDKRGIATTYSQMCDIYIHLEDLASAETIIAKALKLNTDVDYKLGKAANLYTIGHIAFKKDDLENALIITNRALDICTSI